MNKTGDRLNHLLDLIGFRVGRGRVPEFQQYIRTKSIPGLQDLKYSTVRSWFSNNAPPMKKLNLIVDALHTDYEFTESVEQIKVWWKLGGAYPFKNNVHEEFEDISSDKLQFLITSMVTEACGEDFQTLSSTSLIDVKNKAIALARDFANPRKVEVPIEYLRVFIADALKKNTT